MKKLSWVQWKRDVKKGFGQRRGRKISASRRIKSKNAAAWAATYNWVVEQKGKKGLNIEIVNGRRVILYLPEKMNFYLDYESTVLHISAIRKLSEKKKGLKRVLLLSSVNFDNLKKISTSAALVLTAELSKWDDALRQKLRPNVAKWDANILKKFTELGFFDLFQNSPIDPSQNQGSEEPGVHLVRYIKGCCGDSSKTRILKKKITDIVGEEIIKWTFLHSGLTEAITNVCHHAYPDNFRFLQSNKTWYLTGSYSDNTKQLKIVFYDQGIGIPKSLPASKVWERVLSLLSRLPVAERKKDAVLLKAAVQLDRTSTGESDRGRFQ